MSSSKKRKEKKLVLTFFRGPQAQWRVATAEEASVLKDHLIEVLTANSDLRLHRREPVAQFPSCFRLKDYFIFGLNSVIRAIEAKTVVGVLIEDPLAIPLQQNVVDLCMRQQVPFICCPNLSQLKSHFNISSLSAVALKPKVAEKEDIFNKFYQHFYEIAPRQVVCQPNEPADDSGEEQTLNNSSQPAEKTLASEESQDKLAVANSKKEFTNFYTKIQDDNYFELLSKNKSEAESDGESENEFITQQSFVPVSHQSPDVYFPDRQPKRTLKLISKLSWKSKDEDSNDVSFVESLMDASLEAPSKEKRKRKKQETTSNKLRYIPAEVVRLEPSEDNKRREKKKLKQQRKAERKRKRKANDTNCVQSQKRKKQK